jgi:hypothetical protein
MSLAIDDDFRPITPEELAIVRRMLEFIPSGSEMLLDQLSRATVQTVGEYGSIRFHIDGGEAVSRGDGPVVNASQKDQDTIDNYGPFINFVLFLKDGLLDELQIYKDDGKPNVIPVEAKRLVSIHTDRRKT